MAYYPPPPLPFHPGQADAERRPNAATTILAAVFAGIGGFVGLVVSAFALSHVDDRLSFEDILPAAALIVMGLALAIGAVSLFMRKRIGQWLVAIGCVVNLLLLGGVGAFGFDHESGSGLTAGVFGLVVFAVPAVATLVLVVVPSTTRYLTWWPSKGAAYAPLPFPPPRDPWSRGAL